VIQGAREAVGREIVANIVALGIITRIAGVLSEASVREAILTRVPKGTEEMNVKAFEYGLSLADKLVAEEAGSAGAH
jgi:2-oxoglutarate ferredoxin oxidoreductase subunit gamma